MEKCLKIGHTKTNNIIEYTCHKFYYNGEVKMARVVDYVVQHQNVVGDKVKKFRIEQNLSQKDLSERLETYAIYICRSSISRIERHGRTVTDYELKAMSEVLKVSIYDLYE